MFLPRNFRNSLNARLSYHRQYFFFVIRNLHRRIGHQKKQKRLDLVANIGRDFLHFIQHRAIIRNILAYKNKLTEKLTFVLMILCIVAGLWANNRGIIGLFPIVASASYTVLMYTTRNDQQMRYALISNLLLWFVHDFYVQAYPSALTDAALSVWTAVQIIRHRQAA